LSVEPARRALAGRLGIPPEYLERWSGKLMSPHAWRSFSAEQRMLVREIPALEGRLADISVPTTIVAGTGDRIVPIESARRLAAQVPQAHLIELCGAHHLLHQQRPGRVAEIVVGASRQ
jgi:pimeloyl-ACP methyl ester carboxylesterase